MSPPLKDFAAAAEWLGIPEKTLRNLVAARRVPFTRPGGTRHIRFGEEHLKAIAAMGEEWPDNTPLAVVRNIRATHPPAGPSTPPPPPGPKARVS